MSDVDDGGVGRRCAVTLDVDGVRHYHAIHGLPPPSAGADPVIERGVRRFLELCDRLGAPSTLFVVGEDLEDPAFASTVRQAARAGHEIASHSHTHRYDLSRRAPAEIESDLARSVDAVAAAAGARPRGFRAPGYNLSEPLLDALEKLGFEYDSSLMPSPAYWAARAGVLGAYGAAAALRRAAAPGEPGRGRGSSSIPGTFREFLAPRAPFRPRCGKRWARARSRVEGRDLVELPITTGALRTPWLGTTLAMLPEPAGIAHTAAALASLPAGAPCVLELHAVDFIDDGDGVSYALARAQRDLRVSARKKIARLEVVMRMLARSGELVTASALSAAV